MLQMAVQVTIYFSEEDEWRHRPLHMELLNHLRQQNVAGATVLHAVAGFIGRSRVHSANLVDAGGKLPLILIFVDTDEHVSHYCQSCVRWLRIGSSFARTCGLSKDWNDCPVPGRIGNEHLSLTRLIFSPLFQFEVRHREPSRALCL